MKLIWVRIRWRGYGNLQMCNGGINQKGFAYFLGRVHFGDFNLIHEFGQRISTRNLGKEYGLASRLWIG